MSLNLELVKADANLTSFDVLKPKSTNTALEKRLLKVLEHGKTHVASPMAVATPAPTGSLGIDFNTVYLPKLIDALGAGVKATAPPPLTPVEYQISAGDGVRSILNQEKTGWDPLNGASLRIQVTPTAFGMQSLANPLLGFLNSPVLPNTPVGYSGSKYFLSLYPDGALDPRIHECTFCFAAGSTPDIEGIVIFFSQTRGEVVDIIGMPSAASSQGPKDVDSSPLSGSSSSTWKVEWRHDPLRGASICLRVRYVGDPPFVRTSTWLVTRGGMGIVPPVRRRRDLPPQPPTVVNTSNAGKLVPFAITYTDELVIREHAIKSENPVDTDKLFFLELEKKSHPTVSSKIKSDYAALTTFLANRYWARADAHHVGGSTDFAPEEAASWTKPAIKAGTVIEKLLVTHYASGKGINFTKVGKAFERFAGGELTEFGNHGAPDGTNIFCFAELALILIEINHERDVWARLFRIFGCASEIYVGSYHACVPNRTHCSYRIENNPKGRRAPSDATKADIASRWNSASDPRALFDGLVHAALHDDLISSGVGSATAPIPLTDFNCP